VPTGNHRMGQHPETRVLEAFNGSSSPPGIQLLQLLIAIQAASLASFGGGPDFDPKYYVDLPLKYPVDTTAEAFSSLPRTLPSGIISPGMVSSVLSVKPLCVKILSQTPLYMRVCVCVCVCVCVSLFLSLSCGNCA
jgi:hypothetical protein